MVKVIGKDPKAVKTITCQNCASILEYVDADTKRYDGMDYSGGSDGQIWIDCPSCNDKVVIESW